jgi:protein-tyrosine phosphatase
MIRVLFVCMGNICRSPTAEAVFRHRIGQAGFEDRIECVSAGTHGYHEGGRADPRAEDAAAARGYSLERHRARQVRPEDFQDFDYVVAMDRDNDEILRAMAPPGARSQISLFLSHVGNSSIEDVPDPYYGGAEGFDHVIDLVELAADAFLQVIRQDCLEPDPQR